nr:hypothetical protein [FCB group bacterium]
MKRSIIYHALIIALLIFGCAKKPTSPSSDNPFDPENPYTGGDPLGLTAAPLNEGIMLCWNKPAFPSLTGYKLYRSFDEDSLQYNLLAQLQDTVYLDSTITRGYRYFYLVTALSNQGESISSNILPVEVSSVPYMVIDSDNQYTPAMIVTLDILAVYADSMRLAVSPAGSIDESVWETYQSARICTLSADTTAHWIDFQVLYSDGELSPVVRDSIAPHPMYANIIIGDGSGYTNTSPVEFRIVESGALNIMLSEDPAFSGAQWENITQVNSFNLSQGDGLKTIYVKLSNDYFVKDTVCAVTYDTFAEIESVSHDGAGRVLEYGDTLLISLTIIGGESGGECSVDIIDTTGAARSNIVLEDNDALLWNQETSRFDIPIT